MARVDGRGADVALFETHLEEVCTMDVLKDE